MAKIGIRRLLVVLLVGLVIPYGLYRLSRIVGRPILIAAAVALGLAYGAVKADHAWTGDGLQTNIALMSLSALALAAYTAVSLVAATAIARRM